MPNRIIKESICTSDDMASLSWFEQAIFLRLIVTVDDYGRMDARASILKGRLFPLDNVSPDEIDKGLKHMAELGMVTLYSVNGKPFLQLSSWDKHQSQPRAKASKFPSPEEADCIFEQTQSTCEQMQADVLHLQANASRCIADDMQTQSTCEHLQANAPVTRYSNTILDTRYSILEDDYCAEPAESDPAPEPVITLPLNDKSEFPIFEADTDKWSDLYPAVDVMQELRNMRGWLDANPTRRKTKAGVRRFVVGWLAKEQNKGGSAPRGSPKIMNFSQKGGDCIGPEEYTKGFHE